MLISWAGRFLQEGGKGVGREENRRRKAGEKERGGRETGGRGDPDLFSRYFSTPG